MLPFYDWPLPAIALTGLMYPTWRIAQHGRRALGQNPSDAGRQPLPDLGSKDLPGKRIRGLSLRWINFSEFASLLGRFNDLILIDLRQTDQWDPLPVQTPVTAFRVRHHELPEMLEHLPENRTLVFFGLTDLDALIIEASPRAKGSSPIYILDNHAPHREAA